VTGGAGGGAPIGGRVPFRAMADDQQLPEGITTGQDRDHVWASGVVDAPADAVFDFLRNPANHPAISGDESVKGSRVGSRSLQLGDRFGMRMRQFGVPYRITSKVTELEEGRRIAWRHLVGHTWRWELEPTDGGTRVTETFDMTTCRIPWALRSQGYPGGHEGNVARSVANVRDQFAGGS
jgi:hypothetical protein